MRVGSTLVFAILCSGAVQAQDPSAPILDQFTIKVTYDLPTPEVPGTALTSTGDADLDRALSTAGAVEMKRVFRHPPRGWKNEVAAANAGLDRWLLVDLGADRQDLPALLESFQAQPSVEFADSLHRIQIADTVPDDPDFGQQYSLQNGKLGAPKAWDIQKTSTHVTAVLDTGVQLNHPDLTRNIWVNQGEIPNNGIDDEGNGFIDDRRGYDIYYDDNQADDQFGHGIHCAGIVGARANNATQVAGVCWRVPVMPVKMLSNGGGGTDAIAARGMVYAADNGASVFSMSWRFFSEIPLVKAAVDYATDLDIVLVGAAGNEGDQQKKWPAAYDKVMGISATNASDRKTSWSSYGNWIDMSAPGDNILNLYLGSSTARLSGTSMSAPHVAGAAALIREVNPGLNARDTRWVLNYSALDLGADGFDNSFGWGRLDLLAAVRMARSLMISTNETTVGTSVTLDLFRPSDSGNIYLLLPSRRGVRPGISLNGFDPTDFRQMALNYDPLLFPLLLQNPGGLGIFSSFVGTLDASGAGQAMFHIPNIGFFSGKNISFVFVTADPNDLSKISQVSNSVKVKIN